MDSVCLSRDPRPLGGRRGTGMMLSLGLALVLASTTATGAANAAGSDELSVPRILQTGDKANCGPTAAAMMLGAYAGATKRPILERLRDKLGQWSWDRFPFRRMSLPGYDAGASTPDILEKTMNHFADGVSFQKSSAKHPWIPQEAWSVVRLRAHLESRRPVLALVMSSVIWDTKAPGLHWVVVRGIDSKGDVIFNDPADRSRSTVSTARFLRAWKLQGVLGALFKSYTSLVGDGPIPAERRTAAKRPPRTASGR